MLVVCEVPCGTCPSFRVGSPVAGGRARVPRTHCGRMRGGIAVCCGSERREGERAPRGGSGAAFLSLSVVDHRTRDWVARDVASWLTRLSPRCEQSSSTAGWYARVQGHDGSLRDTPRVSLNQRNASSNREASDSGLSGGTMTPTVFRIARAVDHEAWWSPVAIRSARRIEPSGSSSNVASMCSTSRFASGRASFSPAILRARYGENHPILAVWIGDRAQSVPRTVPLQLGDAQAHMNSS